MLIKTNSLGIPLCEIFSIWNMMQQQDNAKCIIIASFHNYMLQQTFCQNAQSKRMIMVIWKWVLWLFSVTKTKKSSNVLTCCSWRSFDSICNKIWMVSLQTKMQNWHNNTWDVRHITHVCSIQYIYIGKVKHPRWKLVGFLYSPKEILFLS